MTAAAHWPAPRWLAHRGAGTLAPENTLAAFRQGAAHGFRAFECDVKLSADGVPFLLHDATLERTTTGTGTAGDQPWHALSQLDAGSWHSRQFAGEPLPTLAALARFVQRNHLSLNIEIKPTPGQEALTGQVVAEHAARLWAGRTEAPLLSSFRPESLLAARQVAPHLPRGLLVDTLWPGWFEVASGLGCTALITNHRLMDADLLGRARAAGWLAMVYTVNEPADADRLLALGVDGLITDRVDLFCPASR